GLARIVGAAERALRVVEHVLAHAARARAARRVAAQRVAVDAGGSRRRGAGRAVAGRRVALAAGTAAHTADVDARVRAGALIAFPGRRVRAQVVLVEARVRRRVRATRRVADVADALPARTAERATDRVRGVLAAAAGARALGIEHARGGAVDAFAAGRRIARA